MKEIGGFFELETFKNDEYHKDAISLNSGRNALLYLLRNKNIKKLYIPYYLCDSIYKILDKNNYKYEFYRIDENFSPILNKEILQDEYIYIVNYYGQINNKKIMNLYYQYKNIILDNTHAFFQKPLKIIDTIYNCRKWFGVPDGAYLYSNGKLIDNLEVSMSKEKMGALLGRYEETANKYYEEFKKIDEKFENEELMKMSKLTHNFLGVIDYEKIKYIRNENYKLLNDQLKKYNKLNLELQDVPFFYPLYIDNIVDIRRELALKKIYIPILWPNVINENEKDTLEYKYANNILPIPCDQRYNQKDMKRIVENIIKILNGV